MAWCGVDSGERSGWIKKFREDVSARPSATYKAIVSSSRTKVDATRAGSRSAKDSHAAVLLVHPRLLLSNVRVIKLDLCDRDLARLAHFDARVRKILVEHVETARVSDRAERFGGLGRVAQRGK